MIHIIDWEDPELRLTPGVNCDPRGVDDEAIPLALDVVVRRLFGDVETVEFQLPGDVLLPLEHHQRNLEANELRRGNSDRSSLTGLTWEYNTVVSVKTSAVNTFRQ